MKKAFTLIELMIVVAILGILAAVVIPSVQGHTSSARDSAAKDMLRTLRNQIELYKFHHVDLAPGYKGAAEIDAVKTVKQFIKCTKVNGSISFSSTPSGTYIHGPYLPEMTTNPYNGLSTITIVADATAFSAVADGTSSGWLYKRGTAEIRVNSTGTDDKGIKHYDF